MHRRLTRRPAARGRPVAQVAYGPIEHRGIVGVENRLYRKDLWMTAKRLHGPRNHTPAPHQAVLLRPPRTGAKAASGGNNDGGCPFFVRHRDLRGASRRKDHASAWRRTALIMPVPGKQTIPNICARITTFCCTALARLGELSKV